MNERKTSSDLASAVLSYLSTQSVDLPAEEHVRDVFQVLFDVSLKTEEGQFVTCSVVHFDPTHVHMPVSQPHNRWHFHAFASSIPFTENDLAKLAKSTDPRSSAVAVFPDEQGTLQIIGLIDQAGSFVGYMNYERDRGVPAPGTFLGIIEGPGRIAAYANLTRISQLSGSSLSGRQLPVFQSGPIHEELMSTGVQYGLTSVLDEVEKRYGLAIVPAVDIWVGYWFSVMCRLLTRVRSFRHGGAIIIISAMGENDLRIKYPLTYDRLWHAVPKFLFQNLVQMFDRQLMMANELPIGTDDVGYPKKLTLGALGAGDQIPQTAEEIDDALWFIANLTRVDGCVVITSDLRVIGYGAEIRIDSDPPKVLRARDAAASEVLLEPLDPSRFGMRHRSMMRWVWPYPQSIGFVVSQDGHVRAMKRHGDAVVLWEDILLQRNFEAPAPATFPAVESMTAEDFVHTVNRDQRERRTKEASADDQSTTETDI